MAKRKPALEPAAKHSFPSPRQAKAAGLRKEFYPPFLRDMVDADYIDKLPEEERVWFGAFLEEHYRGWRLANETQVCPVEHIREAARDAKRQRDHEDPLLFGAHRGPSVEELREDPDADSDWVEGRLLAGSQGLSAHEFGSRNWQEDAMIDAIDRHRRELRVRRK